MHHPDCTNDPLELKFWWVVEVEVVMADVPVDFEIDEVLSPT